MAEGTIFYVGTISKDWLRDMRKLQAGSIVKMKGRPSDYMFVISIAEKPSQGYFASLLKIAPGPRRNLGFVSVDELELCSNLEYQIGDPLSHLVVQSIVRKAYLKGISTTSGSTQFKAFQFRPLISYMSRPSKRILIADETGLGKTISSIYIMLEEMATAALDRIVIICPSHLMRKWQAELWRRFGLFFWQTNGRRLIDSIEGNGGFRCIVSLDAMRDRSRLEHLKKSLSKSRQLDMLIVDEAHHVIGRAGDTLGRDFVQAMSAFSARAIGLTASPLQLEQEDLGRIFEVIDPGGWNGTEFENLLDVQAELNRLSRAIHREYKDVSRQSLDSVEKKIREMTHLMHANDSERANCDAFARIKNMDLGINENRIVARRLLWEISPLAGRLTRTRRIEAGEYRKR
jgi:hypothetical protein